MKKLTIKTDASWKAYDAEYELDAPPHPLLGDAVEAMIVIEINHPKEKAPQ